MEDWGRVVVMLPIAIAASAAMLAVVWREGWLSMAHRRRVVRRELVALNRIGAASVVYVLLLFAYPPPMDVDRLALVAAVFGLWLACLVMVEWLSARTDAWADGPKVGEALQSEIVYSWESDNDTAIDDGWIVQPVDTPVPVVMYDDGRRKDRGSEVSSADSTSNASGEDEARNDVAASASRPASNRGGRGRRLSSAVVQG